MRIKPMAFIRLAEDKGSEDLIGAGMKTPPRIQHTHTRTYARAQAHSHTTSSILQN